MKNTSAKKRILLVGDDMDTCLTFKRLLEEQDFDVHAFIRLQDVLKNFMHYDPVVLDIKMPNIDRIKLYHQLRTVDKNVKVCFITASEEYYIERFPELKCRTLSRAKGRKMFFYAKTCFFGQLCRSCEACFI
jgi:CheY-like chemotaxis protein